MSETQDITLTRDTAKRLYSQGLGSDLLYSNYEDEELKQTWELLNSTQVAYDEIHKEIREKLGLIEDDREGELK